MIGPRSRWQVASAEEQLGKLHRAQLKDASAPRSSEGCPMRGSCPSLQTLPCSRGGAGALAVA